jgi:hypothetical protein
LIALNLWGIHGLLNIGMICQFGFMVFLLTTYKSILNEIKRLIRLKTTDQSAFIWPPHPEENENFRFLSRCFFLAFMECRDWYYCINQNAETGVCCIQKLLGF